ncbi:MAG TPA: NAD(P)-dependent oxidoreductase [Candidatus Limnocylindrales bacterium]|nr:NAD(P)-dependent oxidoreductase [Candidatus Limnocylindrales bacterium]
MRVAVTGSKGRLGRALIEALEEAPFTGPMGPIAWSRPELDVDSLTGESVARLIARDRPEVVVHAAAWTDVDACAREPRLADRRNGEAAGILARACAAAGVELVLVSTNEVFDGRRTDGLGYAPSDLPNPPNPYGASKLLGERLARAAFEGGGVAPPAPGTARLAIVRTSWLHGPPGNDFPAKIAAAALRARDAGEPLRVVADELGRPTWTPDLAEAIAELLGADELAPAGERVAIHHLVNAGIASRADWAREVLRACRIDVPVVDVPGSTWERASTPPSWAVLEPTPLPSGEPMRHWLEAFADAVPALLRALKR